jgi:hypothetical protein
VRALIAEPEADPELIAGMAEQSALALAVAPRRQ